MTEQVSIKAYESLAIQVNPVVARANAVQVTTAMEYDDAAIFLTEVKTKAKLVEDERVRVSKPMNEALRAHNDLFKRLSGPLDLAERTVKGKMSSWYAEQERIREAQERKAREEARAREQAEREKLERQAAKAEAKGHVEAAEELKQRAAEVYVEPAPVAVQTESTVIAGKGSVTMRKDIEIEIENPYALLEAILKEEMPLAWLKFDVQAIKRRAKADNLTPGSKAIPGVRIKPAIVSAVRTS